MGELVPAQPIIRMNSVVSLPVDFISTLSLLYRAVPGAGMDPWLVNARRSLPDETRYGLDILEGFSGRLLYYLEEPITGFDPLAPRNRDAGFADVLDYMTDLSPAEYLDMAIRAVQRVRLDARLDPEPPAVDIADEAERDLRWRQFLDPALTTATPDEVIPLFEDPVRLRLRTINLFRTVWQTVYRDEFLRQSEVLHEAAALASGILHHGFGRVFSDLTDARLPSTLANRLHDISDITFHPSVHLGAYISFILSPPRGIIFFDARRFMQRQHESQRPASSDFLVRIDPTPDRPATLELLHLSGGARPDTHDVEMTIPSLATSEGLVGDVTAIGDGLDEFDADTLIECARALGDSTRFRILEMLADGEHYAQEIVSRLDIAQSAVSRHLGLLERSGLVSVRPQRGMKYYSVSEANVRRFAYSIVARMVTPEH